MHRRLRRRRRASGRRNRQTRWNWTSQELLLEQKGWLGIREYDRRRPACHYNLHIQAACGGPDYHNYHIRYHGIRENRHLWSVVDAPGGQERSNRMYAFSKEHLIGEIIDVASSQVVTDVTNDVGDPSLWTRLSEQLALVLYDLYRHDQGMTA